MERYEKRLKELESMEEGWYGGEGAKISETSLRLTREILPQVLSTFKEVYIFPTISGFVQLEGDHRGDLSYVIEIESETRINVSILKCVEFKVNEFTTSLSEIKNDELQKQLNNESAFVGVE